MEMGIQEAVKEVAVQQHFSKEAPSRIQVLGQNSAQESFKMSIFLEAKH